MLVSFLYFLSYLMTIAGLISILFLALLLLFSEPSEAEKAAMTGYYWDPLKRKFIEKESNYE